MKKFKQYVEEGCCEACKSLDEELELTEAEYQGKKVTLNKPVRGGSKKFYVYTKNEKGNVVKTTLLVERVSGRGTIVQTLARSGRHVTGRVAHGNCFIINNRVTFN